MPSRPSVLGGRRYTPAQVANRAAAANGRNTVEVVRRWRRGRGPLERVAFPWIRRGSPAAAHADGEVDQEDQNRGRDHERADGGHQVPGRPIGPVGIPDGDPARHPLEAKEVHGHEGDVETQPLDPELDLVWRFVEIAP